MNDATIPMPRWESYLRRLYINDAEEMIVWRFVNGRNADYAVRKIKEASKQAGITLMTEMPSLVDSDFAENTWWGRWVRVLAETQELVPYVSDKGKPKGIERAIRFFRYLDGIRKEKEESRKIQKLRFDT